MKIPWDKWLQEAIDWADCQYGLIEHINGERWERDAWVAWATGREPGDFVDEWARERIG